MTEVAGGNPPANPAPAPEATPAPAKPAPGAPPEPTQDAPVEMPRFFSRKREDGGKPAPFDPAKLTPELQEQYKLMQGDYTRKTQEAAALRKEAEEMRVKLDAERQTLMETLRDAVKLRQGPETPPNPEADVLAQIQTLRDEGRHAEADALLRQAIAQEAQAAIAPLKKEADLNLMKTAFRDTSSDVILNNPVVARYKDDVVKVFDGDSAVMQTLRPYILQSEQSIRTFVPLVLNAIATELHARTLEENFDQRVESEVKARLEGRRTAAGRVPARLVESGGSSKTSPPAKVTLKEAFELAREGSTS